MATTRRFQRSLIGGEVTPKLHGQIDLPYYQNGARKLLNAVVEPIGPASRRQGFRFQRVAKTKFRAVPFRYGPTNNAMAEFGDGYVCIHTLAGVLLYGSPSAYKLPETFVPGNVAINPTNRITLTAHPFDPSEPVRFSTDNTLPVGLSAGITYYVLVVDANTIQVSTTPAGPAVTIFTGGVGNHRCVRFYDTGDLTTFGGSAYYSTQPNPAGNVVETAPGVNAFWHLQPATGELEIPTTYTAAQIGTLDYVQSFDVLTIAHVAHPMRELRRYSATRWAFVEVPRGPSLAAPTGVSAARTYGFEVLVKCSNASPGVLSTFDVIGTQAPIPRVPFGEYTCVLLRQHTGSDMANITPGFYLAANISPSAGTFNLMSLAGKMQVGVTYTSPQDYGYVTPLSYPSDFIETYVVTTVDANGSESAPSVEATADNDLAQQGNFNTIQWSAVVGASSYRIYRKFAGVFAYVTETTALTWKDDGSDEPDGSRTAPRIDTTLLTNNPAAVGYYEQRRIAAGLSGLPQTVLFTRSNTESDWVYHLPVQDSDRLSFRVGAREACTVQYVLPLAQLVVLTDSTEFRVTPLNDDALTPASVSTRPQTYVGAAKVRPLLASGTALFIAARDKHVRELGWSAEASSYVTGDLSLRALHLFDGFSILDAAFVRAPWPIAWFPSSSGKLLSLTYVPEERVGAWAQHTTQGSITSVAALPEADGDHLWACAQRVVNGATVHYVERMPPAPTLTTAIEAQLLDAHLTFDGRNTGATTLTAAYGGLALNPLGAAYTSFVVTASSATFAVGDVGASLIFYGSKRYPHELVITQFTSAVQVVAYQRGTFPQAYVAVPVTTWAFARATFTAAHLKGMTIEALGDGVAYSGILVNASTGVFTLPKAAAVACVGLGYITDIEPLPLTIGIPGESLGSPKAVDRARISVASSGVFELGPDAARLKLIDPAVLEEAPEFSFDPVPDQPTGLGTAVVDLATVPKWSADGRLLVRQSRPLPLTVLGIGVEVVIGD
jgi:hypothetical protein